ncbi:MAG: undecaprenyl-diphosphate phosphatase [Candidatus Bathyarchaeota archaeon]|nr:undecaprenyl-diphosphate phosphatase [Candidatus Bathyarchaeota archaeon]MDI6805960.1 undecaprenyl-diphosphate phosphatase [Candidatus Bathyarchaeia archaeon]
MEQLIETIILGIIQGLTEWLPISSTGHLKLAEHFLGLRVPLLFDITLHIGTLIVVLLFFRKDIKNLMSALARFDFKTENGKLIPIIIVGTIPTALIGLAFGNIIENTFQNPLPIAIAFVLCGILLYSAKTGRERTGNIDYSKALIIGVAQGIAIIPGISRSGATIAVALLLGIKREKAFKYSFLLSVPTILGAFGLEASEKWNALTSAGLGWIEVFVGVVVAMVVGYFALKLLWKILAVQKLHYFAFYCWLIALVSLMLSFGIF